MHRTFGLTPKNSPADASTGVIFISPARVNLISPKGVSPACPKGSNARAFSKFLKTAALNFGSSHVRDIIISLN